MSERKAQWRIEKLCADRSEWRGSGGGI